MNVDLGQYRSGFGELEQALKEEVAALRVRMRAELQEEFKRQLQSLQAKLKEGDDRAVARFHKAMTEIDERRRQGKDSGITDRLEQAAKRDLESSLEFSRKLLQDFIAACQRWLQ